MFGQFAEALYSPTFSNVEPGNFFFFCLTSRYFVNLSGPVSRIESLFNWYAKGYKDEMVFNCFIGNARRTRAFYSTRVKGVLVH